jgi:hypothetical protein
MKRWTGTKGRAVMLAALGVWAAVACGGATDNGGGSSGSSGNGGSSGTSGSDAAIGTSGSSGSSGTSGTSGTVAGGAVPCGQAVCASPNVCCEAGGRQGPTCEAQSACATGFAVACTAATCPQGSVCCGTVNVGPTGITGATQCQASCAANSLQLCQGPNDCPTGEECTRLGQRLGGAGDLLVCVARPDGGGFRDGGPFPPPRDAGPG